MSDQQLVRLQDVIREAVTKIRKFQDRSLGEQNTKATLIDPILEALGWDVRDPDEVYREFKPTSKDSPVDYALTILRKPRLFVEAKGLGETLSDRKWIAQVLGYATVAGVEWCVLTDGDEWRFYNATVPLDAEEKLFCRVRLTADESSDTAKMLLLISRSNMEENILDVLWSAHYVDRRVKQALQEMFASVDKSLVRVIRNREPKLTPKDIVESLRRLDVRVESATHLPESPAPRRKSLSVTSRATSIKKARRMKASAEKSLKHYGVSLSDVIDAGLLKPPMKLFRKYKGRNIQATLHPDGSVEWDGNRYQTCSAAADAARTAVTGSPMKTNGWSFWQYHDGNGKLATLFDARDKYLASRKQS